jgi:hypothetical protein
VIIAAGVALESNVHRKGSFKRAPLLTRQGTRRQAL